MSGRAPQSLSEINHAYFPSILPFHWRPLGKLAGHGKAEATYQDLEIRAITPAKNTWRHLSNQFDGVCRVFRRTLHDLDVNADKCPREYNERLRLYPSDKSLELSLIGLFVYCLESDRLNLFVDTNSPQELDSCSSFWN